MSHQYTEVRLARFLSGGFTTMAVINPPESKVAKRTSVHAVAQFHMRNKIEMTKLVVS